MPRQAWQLLPSWCRSKEDAVAALHEEAKRWSAVEDAALAAGDRDHAETAAIEAKLCRRRARELEVDAKHG